MPVTSKGIEHGAMGWTEHIASSPKAHAHHWRWLSLAFVEVPDRVPFAVRGNFLRDGSESTEGRHAPVRVNRVLEKLSLDPVLLAKNRRSIVLNASPT